MPCEDAPHPFAQYELDDRTKDNTSMSDAFPFHNSPSPATEGSTNIKSSPYVTNFLREMECERASIRPSRKRKSSDAVKMVKGAIPKLFKLCPEPETCVQVPVDQIIEEITRLGFQYTRACNLKLFSLQYTEDTWTHITELHGVGKYAANAYAIFCTGRWKDVIPMDHNLIPYWTSLHNAGY
ncbi:hypothetical protein QN277_010752 [Acacia crassicarpa]|nr:hypothetical protein QN277_010752 [Acacia crassicarpa]